MSKIIIIFLFMINQSLALKLNSKANKKYLLELYTSESCSSCPAAEKWLNSFRESDLLWKKVIPLEFHVDYWNHLNWKDPFSKRVFTQRQYNYNKVLKSGVYTPQIISNGNNNRYWRFRKPRFDEEDSSYVLIVDFDEVKGVAKVQINKGEDLTCYGALMKNTEVRNITSGENSGRKLIHEFVVINLRSSKMESDRSLNTCQLQFDKKTLEKSKSFAFWVSDSKTLKVLQAVGADF
ncbi:DUF1223 domain-containing protein [Halobacteriovorax sp. GB3]|uniref:DUF1223 domain-containing protein n=1 Tax=Halobacteriovorax sp. GB3 TaxID=2719615 RepID=UPI0023611647|nr:DUF1223 domain-containing protein [Halobacteriovorax sp. GB3]MDD0854028.1 DUF1223 domain-containing protein [Halobacteriovorax sp. GB3]